MAWEGTPGTASLKEVKESTLWLSGGKSIPGGGNSSCRGPGDRSPMDRSYDCGSGGAREERVRWQ